MWTALITAATLDSSGSFPSVRNPPKQKRLFDQTQSHACKHLKGEIFTETRSLEKTLQGIRLWMSWCNVLLLGCIWSSGFLIHCFCCTPLIVFTLSLCCVARVTHLVLVFWLSFHPPALYITAFPLFLARSSSLFILCIFPWCQI